MMRASVMVLAVLASACARAGPPVTLPAAGSRDPVSPPAGRGLIAGVGRAAITPPPGLGLAGYGLEGRKAVGYRHRLYLRALFLEDGRGERVAFVVADLPFVSAVLHRRAAELLEPQTGIGADRLVLSATHTHAAPGNVADGRLINRFSSEVPGYDSVLAGQLAQAIARAVTEAVHGARPARVRWGVDTVWGLTRNRSLPAYRRNPAALGLAPPGLDSAAAVVDPTLTMLRVDLLAPNDSVFRPAAALSIFAIHGTGNSPENDLYDGDIHAVVERVLERHIDSMAGAASGIHRAVHLFANGTEGDVSPAWPAETRCDPPKLQPVRLHGGSRAPLGWEWVAPRPALRKRCLEAARASLAFIGDSLGRTSVALFDALVPDGDRSLLVTRAFRTLPLTGPEAPPELCPEPLAGAPTFSGSEDGPTRYRGWRWLGLIPSAFDEGGRAVRVPPVGCHAEMRPALGALARRLFTGPHAFPEMAQLSVVRLGGLVLVAVPAEVTTAAGRRFAAAVRVGAGGAGAPPQHVVLLGLANGFIQYVATEEEYRAQHYEGASTLYGPATARVFARELGELAAAMGGPIPTSPPARLAAMTVYPGRPRGLLPRRTASTRIDRAILRLDCRPEVLVAEWRDAAPADVFPTEARLLAFRRGGGGAASDPVAWDDRPDVEVRVLKRLPRGGWRWQVRWWPPTVGRYQLVIAARDGMPELVAPECEAGPLSAR
jgi:neutral ceramidase